MVGPLSKKSAGNIQRMTGAIKMLTRSAIVASAEYDVGGDINRLPIDHQNK